MVFEQFNRPYIVGKTLCEVCGGPVLYPEYLAQRDQALLVCNSFNCKQVIIDKQTMTPVHFKYYFERHKKFNYERQAAEAARKKYIDKVVKTEISKNNSILEFVIKKQSKNLPQPPFQISIPSGLSARRRLREDRLAAYKSHVEMIIKEAFSEKLSGDIPNQINSKPKRLARVIEKFRKNPSLKDISDQLCDRCKGGCCAHGGDQAYLKVSTIQRIKESHPDLSAEDILNEYLSRVGVETIENSCINQLQYGCALPREVRSDTCNGYFCPELRRLHDEFENEASLPPVLAIKRSNTNWNRLDPSFENEITEVALVHQEAIQVIDVRLNEYNE